jgi:cell wall-associated NlpC family hydrolase
MSDPRYPIGAFDRANFTDRNENLRTIAELPQKVVAAVDGLSGEQLDTPYRDGGWTSPTVT